MPKNVRHSAVPLRKINCTLQNALVEKAAWCVAMCCAGLHLKVCSKLGLCAKPATPKNAGHSAPRLQLRNTASAAPQINCTLQIALVEKAARWAARCYAGLALKALSSNCFATSLSPRNTASAAPQNQLQLANCTCRKSCMVCCDVPCGVASKSLLKIRLRCKAGHAEERAAFRSSSTICSAAPTPPSAASAKSIAPCRVHL